MNSSDAIIRKVISAQELARMDERARARDHELFRANPQMRMPVFVGRGDPRYRVRWQAR